jgi:hypothetical protein
MTYPATGSSNEWGFYFSDGSTPVNMDPPQPPAAAPIAPQSPSGLLNPEPANPTGGMITQDFLSGIGENIPTQGTVAQTVQPQIAGVPASAIQWNNATPGNGSVGNKFS